MRSRYQKHLNAVNGISLVLGMLLVAAKAWQVAHGS